MSVRRAATVAAGLLALAGDARAEPDLRVRAIPAPEPSTLAIRPPTAAAAAAAAAAAPANPATDPTVRGERPEGELYQIDARLRRELARGDAAGARRNLKDKVVFRFNLGFGLDGGRPAQTDETDSRLLSGSTLEAANYERLRTYTFGDAVVGTRGLGVASLNTYFASAFRFDHFLPSEAVSAVPSVQDGTAVDEIRVRSAYAETAGFLSNRFLRPLYLKAGRMFEYGPAVVQFDGANLGYHSPVLKLAGFAGTRAGMFGNTDEFEGTGDNAVTGYEVEVDLYSRWKLPAVIRVSGLDYAELSHTEASVAYQYNPDILLRAGMRMLEGDAARQEITLRARLSDVTTLLVEFENRLENDWVYDYLMVDTGAGVDDIRNYLNIGPPLPRAMMRLRAGTVLLSAVDLLVSGAAAVEHADDGVLPSTFSSSFLEGGLALDVRVRRAIRIGASFDGRTYRRQREPIEDTPGVPDPLFEDTGDLGERSYAQTGGRIRYTTGARGFSAEGEFYARIYAPRTPYIETEELEVDSRLGGRFGIEAWVGQTLRLKAVYDVSGTLVYAPEITGLKSLRVMMEGSF